MPGRDGPRRGRVDPHRHRRQHPCPARRRKRALRRCGSRPPRRRTSRDPRRRRHQPRPGDRRVRGQGRRPFCRHLRLVPGHRSVRSAAGARSYALPLLRHGHRLHENRLREESRTRHRTRKGRLPRRQERLRQHHRGRCFAFLAIATPFTTLFALPPSPSPPPPPTPCPARSARRSVARRTCDHLPGACRPAPTARSRWKARSPASPPGRARRQRGRDRSDPMGRRRHRRHRRLHRHHARELSAPPSSA